MYRLMYLMGFVVRELILPNPFTPLGNIGEIINLGASVLFVPLSYAQVSVIYSKGSSPAWGSFLFTVMYAINTGAVYLIMLLYPIQWLMILAAVVYLIGTFTILAYINNKSF